MAVGDAGAVIAGRNFWMYYMAWDDTNVVPDITDDYGDVPAGYANVGYTTGGIGLAVDVARSEIRVDQEQYPVYNPITEANVALNTQLAQMTPANMKLATGIGTIASVAAASGARGYDELSINSEFTDNFNTVIADVKQPDGMRFLMGVWKGLATGTVDTSFTADDAATTAYEVTGQVDSSTNPARIAFVRDVTAALP